MKNQLRILKPCADQSCLRFTHANLALAVVRRPRFSAALCFTNQGAIDLALVFPGSANHWSGVLVGADFCRMRVGAGPIFALPTRDRVCSASLDCDVSEGAVPIGGSEAARDLGTPYCPPRVVVQCFAICMRVGRFVETNLKRDWARTYSDRRRSGRKHWNDRSWRWRSPTLSSLGLPAIGRVRYVEIFPRGLFSYSATALRSWGIEARESSVLATGYHLGCC